MNVAGNKNYLPGQHVRDIIFVFAVITALSGILFSCSDPVTSPNNGDTPIENKSNWFKVDGSTYPVASAYLKTGFQDSLLKSSSSVSGITLMTASGMPFMTISIIGNTVPTGTWSLPSSSAYMIVMGHTSKLYHFLPITPDAYLLSDKCKNASSMIGGSLTISKTDSIYEITVTGAKLTTTIHQTSDPDDPHPEGTVTVAAHYKGTLLNSDTENGTGECGKNTNLPSGFIVRYNFLFLNSTLAKVGNDFYDELDGFYKKRTTLWDLYTKNADSVWVRKDTSVCPFKKCVLLWDPANESVYQSLPAEDILGFKCRKYSFSFSDTTAMTYWVHPEYDIILKYTSNYIMSLTYEVTSFSATVSSWSDLGITAP